MVALADVTAAADALWDPTWAESWDSVGLVCGDPSRRVERIHLAVDPTSAVVAEAVAAGADLLLTHHPLLLRGVHSVAADTPKGRVLHELIRAGCALFAAHTNADVADPGVSDALARAVGLRDLRPLRVGAQEALDILVTFAPLDAADRVQAALAGAGAGALGSYTRCAFSSPGEGTFLPGEGATPAVGRVGEIETVAERRIEVVLARSRREAVLSALHAAHPYEEPAIHLSEAVPTRRNRGIGRVGELGAAVPLGEFVRVVAASLPSVAGGLRATGDADRPVRTVAVSGGAGDSYLTDAAGAGADVFLTSDLRHHPASDTVEAGGPALIDAPHFATEWPWLPQAARQLRTVIGDSVELFVSELVTDPWTQHAPSPGEPRIPKETSSRS